MLEAVGDRLIKYDTWRGTWYNRLLECLVFLAFLALAHFVDSNEKVIFPFIGFAVLSGANAYMGHLKTGKNERWYILPLLHIVALVSVHFWVENGMMFPVDMIMAAAILAGVFSLFWQE